MEISSSREVGHVLMDLLKQADRVVQVVISKLLKAVQKQSLVLIQHHLDLHRVDLTDWIRFLISILLLLMHHFLVLVLHLVRILISHLAHLRLKVWLLLNLRHECHLLLELLLLRVHLLLFSHLLCHVLWVVIHSLRLRSFLHFKLII